MRNLWLDLAACARWSTQASPKNSEARDASVSDALQRRLRILQLFRHEAAHMVAALQAYMQGQLLGTCWDKLQSTVMVSCTQREAHPLRGRTHAMQQFFDLQAMWVAVVELSGASTILMPPADRFTC